MLNLLVAASMTFTNAGIKSPEACEELIAKTYNTSTKSISEVEALVIGRGKYATHFNYKVLYAVTDRKGNLLKHCVDHIYCASYDDQINIHSQNCME
jgi:hypothetical protein